MPALFAVHGRQVWALKFGTSKPKDGSLGPSALVHQPVHARGASRGASMTGGYAAASVKLPTARLQDSCLIAFRILAEVKDQYVGLSCHPRAQSGLASIWASSLAARIAYHKDSMYSV